MAKKVSIIIPTFNSSDYISRAVQSIKDQNYPDIEILIIDDGSNDNTELVCQQLSKKNPEIILFKNSRTKGASGARNTGILKASGEYIAFLDSDDMWLKDHLSTGVQFLEDHPEVDVLFGNFEVVEHETNRHQFTWFDEREILSSLKVIDYQNNFKVIQDNLLIALVNESFFHVSSCIMKNRLCKNTPFNESVTHSEDRDFAIRLYKDSKAVFAYREDPSHIYYKTPSSLTCPTPFETRFHHNQKILEDRIYLFSRYLCEYNGSKKESRNLKAALAESYLELSYNLRKQLQYRGAIKSTFRSMKNKFSFNNIIEISRIIWEGTLRTIR